MHCCVCLWPGRRHSTDQESAARNAWSPLRQARVSVARLWQAQGTAARAGACEGWRASCPPGRLTRKSATHVALPRVLGAGEGRHAGLPARQAHMSVRHGKRRLQGLELGRAGTLAFLEEFKTAASPEDRELLLCVARTSLRTKLYSDLADQLTEIVVDAVLTIRRQGEPIDLYMARPGLCCGWLVNTDQQRKRPDTHAPPCTPSRPATWPISPGRSWWMRCSRPGGTGGPLSCACCPCHCVGLAADGAQAWAAAATCPDAWAPCCAPW